MGPKHVFRRPKQPYCPSTVTVVSIWFLVDFPAQIPSCEINALVGDDDKQILAELEKINFQGFTAEPVRTEKIVLWFLPKEVEQLDRLLDEAAEAVAADQTYAAPLRKYRELFDSLVKAKKLQNVKNTAVAFMWLIERTKAAADRAERESEASEA